MIAAIVTDSGLSESSESAVTLTTDNLQQHVIASSSATTPVTVTQTLPGLGVIGSNNYGTTGVSISGAGGGVGVTVNTAALMEMGHSRNSSNTSQVSTTNNSLNISCNLEKAFSNDFPSLLRCQKVRVIVVFRTVNIRGKVPRVTRGTLGK